MTNYSNWFAYYRTRIQAAKTVISQNFSVPRRQFRVGFHTLSNIPAGVVRQRETVRRRGAKRTRGTRSCSASRSRWAATRRTWTRWSASASCSRTAPARRWPVQPTRSCCRASATSTCCSPTASEPARAADGRRGQQGQHDLHPVQPAARRRRRSSTLARLAEAVPGEHRRIDRQYARRLRDVLLGDGPSPG